jgi:hypothetical protein
MAVLVAEQGDLITVTHRGTGYTAGLSVSQDHSFLPGFVHVHVGMARVQATVDGPLGASVGIASVTFDNGAVLNFGGPDTWETAAYPMMGSSSIARKLVAFTLSAWVNKGDLTGWSFLQAWA